MRHMKSGRKFSRTSSHRKAMFRNMSCSLIEHEVIKTTLPKAKELRRYIEPLITLAKEDTVANRRLARQRLHNKRAIIDLFEELGPRYLERSGGYTRIIKCGFRNGDAAPMAYIELVDRPERVSDEDVEIDFNSVDEAPEVEAIAADADVEDAEIVEEASMIEASAEPDAVQVQAADDEAPEVEAEETSEEEGKD